MPPSNSPHQAPGSEFWNKLWAAVAISTSFAVLYGLFIALAVVSVYHLVRKGVRRSLGAIQLFAVTALFVSTTIHWAVAVLHRLSALLHDPNDAAGVAHKVASQALRPQCVGTATLTVNIVLSDLVVWWRVWVLWRDSHALYRSLAYICGGVLLAATFTTGVIDTSFSCKAQGGFMYEGLLVGTVASMLSLATNLAATALTAYKAWVHRRCIRRHVASGSQNTQVGSIFALLVGSGALYCTLWIVVVVWQIGARGSDPQMRTSFFLSPTILDKHAPDAHSFWFKGGVLIEGCLVPLIAIYPAAIIVLVALNKSAVENGFKPDFASPPGIAVAVETVVSTHSDFEDSLPGTTGHFGDPGQRLEGSEKMAHTV
ncbi:hypothetical protein V8D89_009358 [Ganoderma adspersum]